MTIQFSIPGPPQGKARPKFGKGRAYTPNGTVIYEKIVRCRYLAEAQEEPIMTGPVTVDIWAFYPIPKSAGKSTREKMCHMELRPTKKPDLDNVAKIICDALNGLAYKDDAQVVELRVHKDFSESPKVVVTLLGD